MVNAGINVSVIKKTKRSSCMIVKIKEEKEMNTKVKKRIKGILFVFSVICISLTGTSLVFAEEGDADYSMDEMVVTGTKSEQRITETPVRTEVITAEDIKLKGAVNLYEALEGTPGIRVEQQCSACNFSQIRMMGLEANHVQVLIDGQPIYTGLFSVYGLQQVPTENIERIEIVKGAGSALYGSGAIAGTINVITKKPTKDGPSVSGGVQFGSDATNIYTLSAMTNLKDKADLIVSAQKTSGDEIDENGDLLTDRVWSDGYNVNIRTHYYDLLGDDVVTLGFNTLGENRKGGDLTNGNWENAYAASSEHIDTHRNDYTLGYKKTFELGNTAGFQLSYSTHDRDATNDTFISDYEAGEGSLPTSDLLNPYKAEEKNLNLDVNYSHPVYDHTLLAGFQYNNNDMEESGMYYSAAEGAYKSTSEKEADDWGIYVQDEWDINDQFTLIVGGRYDMHDSKDNFGGSGDTANNVENTYEESKFNPRGALLYRPSDELQLRASVGTGFRVPYSFSEDLHLCSGSPRVHKPSGLSPEESVSYSLSGDYTMDKFSANINLFRVDLENKIGIADADGSTPTGYDYQWQNEGDAYTQGIEIGGSVQVLPDFVVSPYFTYTDAQYDNARSDFVGTEYEGDSKYISRIPEFAGGIGLAYSPGTWNFNFGADWTGAMYIDDESTSTIVKTGSYWVCNARAAKTFPKHGLEVFVGAKNLFDEVQEDRRTDDAAFIYAPLTGRLVYAGAKFQF
jgi:outer membrane receptor for ferrienterochelin and colicins